MIGISSLLMASWHHKPPGQPIYLQLSSSDLDHLDGVGGRIWELIDGHRAVEEIKEIILSEFDASPGQAEHDLMAF